MQKIMAVNAGSSSIKFQLLSMPEEIVIASGLIERIGLEDANVTIKYNDKKHEAVQPIKDHAVGVKLVLKMLIELKIVDSLEEITGVGHRVVQGGEFFQDAAIINEAVIQKIADLKDLAPLHNPAHITGIKAFQEALPKVIQVAVFDTTFHQTMEKETFMYATPYEYYEKYGVRKYGFHGTSHNFVAQECAKLLNKKDSKIIICHIGNGASLCAVKDGKSIDTSMGLTPLEGIPMGTRTGNLDPTLIDLISTKENKSVNDILNVFNKKSGYIGISGVSHDARDLTKGMNEGNERCKLAFDIQAKRIVDYIASYYVLLGGCDAICFTAGIGENVWHLRENIINRLAVLGAKLDTEKNKTVYGSQELISHKDSKIKVFVIPTNEEVMIARDVIKKMA
ncbi:MAG: acetate kinase [Erysipelotrichales bacterium]|nr:acetate kinase [Erysipelotrichales bacterium]